MAPASTAEGHWALPPGFGKKRRDTKAMLPATLEATDALIDEHPIDPDRVYVTGQSPEQIKALYKAAPQQ